MRKNRQSNTLIASHSKFDKIQWPRGLFEMTLLIMASGLRECRRHVTSFTGMLNKSLFPLKVDDSFIFRQCNLQERHVVQVTPNSTVKHKCMHTKIDNHSASYESKFYSPHLLLILILLVIIRHQSLCRGEGIEAVLLVTRMRRLTKTEKRVSKTICIRRSPTIASSPTSPSIRSTTWTPWHLTKWRTERARVSDPTVDPLPDSPLTYHH